MDWLRVKRLSPGSPVLTVEEARDHLRVGHDFDVGYIERLIAAAVSMIEGPTGAGIPLSKARWCLTMDHLPCRFDIDLCPVVSLDEITVEGETIDPSTYAVDLDSTPARVVGAYHPRHCTGVGAVKVEFTAGYEIVPADLRHAVLMLIGHLYEHREATSEVDLKDVPFSVNAIINRYRAF